MTTIVPTPVRSRAVDWVLVVFCCLIVFATTLLSLAFLPAYWGDLPFPASALLVGVVLTWAIRAGYRLTGSMWAAASPLIIWFLLLVYLVFAPFLGSDLVPAYFGYRLVPTDWRTTVLLAVGVLAGAGILGGVWGDHLAAKYAKPMQSSQQDGSASPLT